jgi:hypothetical protein
LQELQGPGGFTLLELLDIGLGLLGRLDGLVYLWLVVLLFVGSPVEPPMELELRRAWSELAGAVLVKVLD